MFQPLKGNRITPWINALPLVVLAFFFVMPAFGQIKPTSANFFPLYVSKQTTEKSVYRGEYHYATKENESGSFQYTSSDNLVANIGPNIIFGENESKTWYGSVSAAVIKAPEPGKSENASLTGTLTLNYRPIEKMEDAPPMVPVIKKTTINFVIYSLNAEITAPDSVCAGEEVKINLKGYPEGGKFTSIRKYQGKNGKRLVNDGFLDVSTCKLVSVPGGLQNGASNNTQEVIKIYEDIFLVYTYEINDVTFRATKCIKVRSNGGERTIIDPELSKTTVFNAFNDRVAQTLQIIPGGEKVVVSPMKFTTTERKCCDATNGAGTQKISTSDVKTVVEGTDIALKSKPYKGKITKKVNKFGYGFEVDANYSAKVSSKGEVSGSATIVENGCKQEACTTASAEIKINSNFIFNLKGTLYLLDGFGKRKKDGKTEFSIISPEIPVKYRGTVFLNPDNCGGGLMSHLGVNAASLIFNANMGGYEFSTPIEILPSMDIKTD